MVVALVGSPSLAGEASAQGSDDPVVTSELVELPGDCENDIAIYDPAISVDCVFRLLPDVETEDVTVASLSDGDGIFVQCAISGRVIRCPDVGGDFTAGERQLTLDVGDESLDGAARLRADWPTSTDLYVSLPTTEAVTFEGLPVDVFAYPAVEVEGLFINVRVRGSKRIVDSIELDPGTPQNGGENQIEFDLPPGRYRMWPCIGPSPTECVEAAGGSPFQVIDPTALELVPGHNRRSAERINVLFVGSNLGGGRDQVAIIARDLLGLDGPVPIDIDGGRAFEAADIVDVRFGPMAIEPLASNAHKFNFWYLDANLGSELSLVFDATFSEVLDVFGLPNLHVTALYGDPNGVSDARATSFYGRATVPPTDQIRFGGTRVAIAPEAPLFRSETLAHEWGHAIFELRDEYYGFDGRNVAIGYPNCAPSADVGSVWWSSMIGDVDPFVDDVLAVRASYGLEAEPFGAPLADLVRIEPNLGGCYGNAGEPTAFRPSQDSLMNSEIPVFGSANRSRVDIVLSRFSGSGPLSSFDDLSLLCSSTGIDFECVGSLPTYVEAPEKPLLVGGEPCTFQVDVASMELAADGVERQLVRCEGQLPVETDVPTQPEAGEPEPPDDGEPAATTVPIQLGATIDTIEVAVSPERTPAVDDAPIEQGAFDEDSADSTVSPTTTAAEPRAQASDAPVVTSEESTGEALAGGDGGASGLIALAVGAGVLVTGIAVAGGLAIRQRRDAERSRQ